MAWGRLEWGRLARWRMGLARRLGWLAWWRMGMGSGLRGRFCSRICLGCRTRLGLGSRVGKSLLVRQQRPALRLGACASLAFWPSGCALSLALLVIRPKYPPLPQGNL